MDSQKKLSEKKTEKAEEITIDENIEVPELGNDTFDLTNEEELKELAIELNTSTYFKPDADITYKIELTTTHVQRVIKKFEDKDTKEKKELTKYVLGVKTISERGEEFEGTWEVGRSLLNKMIKDFKIGSVFKLTKTGSGLDTRYSIIKDF